MTRRTSPSPTWTATMTTPHTRCLTHGRVPGPHAQADEDLDGDHDDTPHKVVHFCWMAITPAVHNGMLFSASLWLGHVQHGWHQRGHP